MNISMDIKLDYNAVRAMASDCLTEMSISRIKDIMWNFPHDDLTLRTDCNGITILSAYHPSDCLNRLISFDVSLTEAQNVTQWITEALPKI